MSASGSSSRTDGKAEPVKPERPAISKPDIAAPLWNAALPSLLIWSIFCVLPGGAAAGPAASARTVPLIRPDISAVAVFGNDDRTDLPALKLEALSSKIGVLSVGKSNFCTAFCVAPDTIATASHCLHGTAEQAGPDLSEVTFNVGGASLRQHSSSLAGSARTGFGRSIRAGTRALRTRPPIAAERDWAVARLSRPVCTAGGLPLSSLTREEIENRATRNEIYEVGMHRDVAATRLLVSTPCAMARAFPQADEKTIASDFANPRAILFHTCDTGVGSSGGPLLYDGPSGPEVVGINVGTYVISPPAANPSSVTQAGTKPASEAIANTAVPVERFRRAVSDFAPPPAMMRADAP